MPVIDIDTHFEPGRSWLAEHPRLAGRLPEYSVAESTVRAQVGDLLAGVPEHQRPPREELLPPGIAAILGQVKVDGYGFEGSAMHAHNESNPEPTAHYEALLADVDPALRASFLGGNLAECYVRMGDPLAIPAVAS